MPCSHRACASGESPDAQANARTPLPGRPGPRHRQRAPSHGRQPRQPPRTGRPGADSPCHAAPATRPDSTLTARSPRRPTRKEHPDRQSMPRSPGNPSRQHSHGTKPPAAEHGRMEARHGSGTQCRRRAMLRGTMPQNDRAPESSATDSGARPVFAAATARHALPPAAPRRSAAPCHTRGGRQAAGCGRA